MPINVSSRSLQAFLALKECQNFTRAAERCHVSQSTLSAMIAKLEDAVGALLFIRNTRNVALTPEGELFAEGVTRINNDIESLFSNLRDHATLNQGQVSIAALPSLAAGALPTIIASYISSYPKIKLKLFDVVSDRCLDLLRTGTVELALTAPGTNSIEFNTQILCQDRFVIVCHEDHPLATYKSLRWKDTAGYRLISFPHTSSVQQFLDTTVKPLTAEPTNLEVEGLTTAAGLIANKLGISIIPELSLFHFQHSKIRAIPLQEPDITRPILIVTLKNKKLSVAAQELLERIKAHPW